MLDHDEEKINRLNQQFAFIREIDKEKFIGRQTYLTDGRAEGERCGTCMAYGDHDTCCSREYANQKIDVLKTVMHAY